MMMFTQQHESYYRVPRPHPHHMLTKYVYESDAKDEEQNALIDQLSAQGVEIVNAKNWDSDKRKEFYESVLFPRSIENGLKLRGRVRTHKAGRIDFSSGVLVVGRMFFVGTEEILEKADLNLKVADIVD